VNDISGEHVAAFEAQPARRQGLAAIGLGGLLLACVLGWLVFARTPRDAAAAGEIAAPVVVAIAAQRPFAVTLEAPANVTPLASVTIRSRVDGQLLSLHFKEGDVVRAGDVLARIDPRPFEAALREANANLSREQARLRNAQIEYERAQTLSERGFASRVSVDARRAEYEQVRATVDGARAGVSRAALNLDYAVIRSPIAGRMGFRLADPGNLISSADRSPLATVVQQRPISAVFALPQRELTAVAAGSQKGLPVTLSDGRSGAVLARGAITSIDNAVSTSTGTFQVRATFANADDSLWPGQLVQASVLLRTVPDAVVVPAQAVQQGPDGPFAFVVDGRAKAKLRKLVEGGRAGGLATIARGLSPGERVVVDGQYGLRGGSAVKITSTLAF
jgi:multidrug efflux system membrane fusion protein